MAAEQPPPGTAWSFAPRMHGPIEMAATRQNPVNPANAVFHPRSRGDNQKVVTSVCKPVKQSKANRPNPPLDRLLPPKYDAPNIECSMYRGSAKEMDVRSVVPVMPAVAREGELCR